MHNVIFSLDIMHVFVCEISMAFIIMAVGVCRGAVGYWIGCSFSNDIIIGII